MDKFKKVETQEWDARLTRNKKDVSRPNVNWIHVLTFNSDLIPDFDLEFSTSNFEIAVSQEWEGSIGCYTYCVTLSYGLDLVFSWSVLKNAVSQE